MKTFLFDVDDTLYNQRHPFERAFLDTFDSDMGLDLERVFEVSRKRSDEVFKDSAKGIITMDEMYIYRMQMTMRDFNVVITDDQALTYQANYEKHQAQLEMPETIKEMLNALSGKVTMGVISNGPNEHQWDKIRAINVPHWIPEENIFVSGALDVAKPDREIFDYVIDKMDVSREDVYFVGDSYDNDVVGAKNAGLKVVWLNRRHEKNLTGIVPDYEVETEAEMYQLLMQLCEE